MISMSFNATAAFRGFLEQAGFDLSRHQIVADGKWRNVPLAGQRDGRSGGYCLHLDGAPVGFAKNHKTGEQTRWVPEREYSPPTAAERAAIERKAAERAREKQEVMERCADKAAYLWGKARPADSGHPYIVSKGIQPHDMRQLGDRLVLSLTDPADDRVWSVQFIASDGTKRLLKGARKDGLVHRFGPEPNGYFAVAEGAATAATVAEALGCTAYMAIDSGNLLQAATGLRARFPETRILLAADNDWSLPLRGLPNVGRVKAEEAARAIGAGLALPLAADGVTDWQDAAARYGLTAVKWQLRGLYQEPDCATRVERGFTL